jgi:hypothetical protein
MISDVTRKLNGHARCTWAQKPPARMARSPLPPTGFAALGYLGYTGPREIRLLLAVDYG